MDTKLYGSVHHVHNNEEDIASLLNGNTVEVKKYIQPAPRYTQTEPSARHDPALSIALIVIAIIFLITSLTFFAFLKSEAAKTNAMLESMNSKLNTMNGSFTDNNHQIAYILRNEKYLNKEISDVWVRLKDNDIMKEALKNDSAAIEILSLDIKNLKEDTGRAGLTINSLKQALQKASDITSARDKDVETIKKDINSLSVKLDSLISKIDVLEKPAPQINAQPVTSDNQ